MARRRTKEPSDALRWMTLGFRTWWMWAEAAQVIALRSAMFAMAGPGASQEAQRMVLEKVEAAWLVWARLARTAPLAPDRALEAALAVYRPRVVANRRRLARRVP
ncbi:hypothetical protein MTR62_15870 [Novosphingobium sp. 1949]|uniref:Uncharacterized protein n=1 Tax=Novosphingobium organovorum TaxID=2930092 RepID=A0ABT0BGI9_9SPHN|nr:hypothetical protein [Novosphingobium organovorum]MCJ2184157.1 hypothetical protein [Novosphingobium organovorum]